MLVYLHFSHKNLAAVSQKFRESNIGLLEKLLVDLTNFFQSERISRFSTLRMQWKNEKTFIEVKFRQINYLVKPLFSRNFCQKFYDHEFWPFTFSIYN